jgi:hypothetical protein
MPQNNSEQPIEIRGHHLEAYADFLKGKLNHENFADVLIQDEYIKDKGDPFVDYVAQCLNLVNTDKPVKITSGVFDIFCKKCHFNLENKCVPYNHESMDDRIAREFGIEVGRTYTFREIKEILENSRREN